MSDYYALVTTTGLAKLAALPVGGTLTLTHMAFGNSTIDPTEDMTALHSEQHRCALLNVEVEATNPNNLAAEAVIDSTVGGFWIREVGIYDEDGDLFAVGKYPATYKPETTEGTVKELGVRMILAVSNAEDVIVTYHSGIMQGAANQDLSNLTPTGQQKFDVKADIASPEFTGTPKAPTATAGTNTTQIATTEFVTAAVAAAISALVDSSPAALDTLKELATALGNDANFSTTVTNALAAKAAKTNDTITVATADPTSAFNVRNVKATSVDPGELSSLANGQILLVYE
ncbi:MAG: phage tail protein [Alphaproteobacteria bacterium]|nr:phage tail protein [Alphaproteobacteria bacterium]